MSTLCRAGSECQGNVCQGNKTERVSGFHSPDPFFRPIHLSAFLKGQLKGGRKISDLFFRGARPSRSPCGASRAAHPVKDVFGGTPNTARKTHALPIHLSALLDLIPIALMEIHLKCAVHGL